jgi:hypothetical protein
MMCVGSNMQSVPVSVKGNYSLPCTQPTPIYPGLRLAAPMVPGTVAAVYVLNKFMTDSASIELDSYSPLLSLALTSVTVR